MNDRVKTTASDVETTCVTAMLATAGIDRKAAAEMLKANRKLGNRLIDEVYGPQVRQEIRSLVSGASR